VIAIIRETFRNATVKRPPLPRSHDQLSAVQWVAVIAEFHSIYISLSKWHLR